MNLLNKLYEQASEYGVSKADLTNEHYGERNVTMVRRMISVILYNETSLPFKTICKAVGYKEHTTVLEHVRRYRKDINFRGDVSNFHAGAILG